METLQQLQSAWNAKADEKNQWFVLGYDEIVEFAQSRAIAAERERCSAEFVENGRAIGRLEERKICAKLADDLGHFGLRDAILGRTHAL